MSTGDKKKDQHCAVPTKGEGNCRVLSSGDAGLVQCVIAIRNERVGLTFSLMFPGLLPALPFAVFGGAPAGFGSSSGGGVGGGG